MRMPNGHFLCKENTAALSVATHTHIKVISEKKANFAGEENPPNIDLSL
jgi:hypothetical protein